MAMSVIAANHQPLLCLIYFPLHLFSRVIISVDSCPLLELERSRPSTSTLTVMMMPSLKLPHCSSGSTDIVLLPVPSKLLWAPGSCQKSFSSQSPTGASQS